MRKKIWTALFWAHDYFCDRVLRHRYYKFCQHSAYLDCKAEGINLADYEGQFPE